MTLFWRTIKFVTQNFPYQCRKITSWEKLWWEACNKFFVGMDTSKENKIRNFNPFVPHALFLYPLKTSRKLMVFCFQRLKKGCIGNEWVNTYQKYFYAYAPEKVRLTHTPDNVWDKLTYSFPMHPFSTPWKHQKTERFWCFQGGRERVHWEWMG